MHVYPPFMDPPPDAQQPASLGMMEVESTLIPQNETEHQKNDIYIEHKSTSPTEILLSFIIIFLPLAIFSIVLIAIVYLRRIQHSPSQHSSLLPIPIDEPNVYYIRISATTLVLLASFSSSIAPTLITFVMSLIAYPISQHILRLSNSGKEQGLPTPYQLGLLITLLNGGIGALWHWITYIFTNKGRKKVVGIVTTSACTLVIANILMVLIILTDIWLHIATTTFAFNQLSPAIPVLSFGRGLNASCPTGEINAPNGINIGDGVIGGNVTIPCSIVADGNGRLSGSAEAYKTVNNASEINQIITVFESELAYVLLGDKAVSGDIDFVASTVGITTQCTPISKACGLWSRTPDETLYNCSADVSGNLGSGPSSFNFRFLNDSAAISLNVSVDPSKEGNPQYFVISAIISSNGDNRNYPLYNDTQITHPMYGGDAYILLCNSTVYEITYITLNANISVSSIKLTNSSLAQNLHATMDTVGTAYMTSAAELAAFSTTSQDMADQIAWAYSKISLGFASGIFSNRPNIEEQSRQTIFVARMPIAPFYTLITLNFLYGLLGGILGVMALRARKEGRVGEVKIRLSVWGVVAQAFETVEGPVMREEDLFGENLRGCDSVEVIGVERGDNGNGSSAGFRLVRRNSLTRMMD